MNDKTKLELKNELRQALSRISDLVQAHDRLVMHKEILTKQVKTLEKEASRNYLDIKKKESKIRHLEALVDDSVVDKRIQRTLIFDGLALARIDKEAKRRGVSRSKFLQDAGMSVLSE